MMDTEILDMLENIGRTSVARLTPTTTLPGETVAARRDAVLRVIRGTILPRRLEFTAANGDCLSIEVNSSRITDVFRVCVGAVPDFETEPRDELTGKLAQLVTDIACAPAPIELLSMKPDAALEADDVGITFSEVAAACAGIEVPAEPIVSVVANNDPVEEESSAEISVAQRFFDGAQRLATGRILASAPDGAAQALDGNCAPDAPLHPSTDLLKRFAADLAGWDRESEAEPGDRQLIVMRPSGGKGASLAILHDGAQFAIAVHQARKLGAVVNLWTALQEADQ